MTIYEAIEIKRTFSFRNEHLMTKKEVLADDLSIEALKYIRYRDNCPGINTRLLLDGETEK